MTVRVEDQSRVQELLKIIQKINSTVIEVGIFGSDDSKILMIANVNEFGLDIKVTPKMRNFLRATGLPLKSSTTHIKIPERSFIRGSYDKNKRRIEVMGEVLIERVLNFEITPQQMFDQIGSNLVGMAQEYLTDLRSPANHPYTLEKKKPKTNPLINIGTLRERITFKVR